MTVLNAHFDGQQIVLDDPMPKGVPANARVRVLIEDEGPKPSSLEKIAKMAVRGKLPRDFSMQHKHYAKGTGRR
ncbi:MAG: hypothetical protein NTU53_02210 [Planctomycetota bacterium]|nr:hypothetical protein [Planctomycetota bacterium]